MTTRKSSQNDHESPIDASLRAILMGRAERVEIEDLDLWSYVLGILDPDEEKRVAKLVACSKSAKDVLKVIRAGALPRQRGAVVLSLKQCQTRAKKLLDFLKERLTSFAGVIVEMPGGLLAEMAECETLIPEAVLLADTESTDGQHLPAQRIDIPSGSGIEISFIRGPEGRVDLLVRVSQKLSEGWVRLHRLNWYEGSIVRQKTHIKALLKNQQARLESCPHGLIELDIPGDRSHIFALESV